MNYEWRVESGEWKMENGKRDTKALLVKQISTIPLHVYVIFHTLDNYK